ncbi:MAG: P1 family peptidase [Candidatus Rokubacteria bacterium]|nr:P1 family peptidase [Candidatus Rokubacteria bacterium]
MITDVPGIRVGHAHDPVALTGVTVVLCDRPAVCGVDRRGPAADVVGLDHLDPGHLVTVVDAVVLGGGSRFGEEAVYGVMRWLEEQGRGFAVGKTVVPHVAGAFLFDLNVGDYRVRPTREMGYEAASRAAAGAVAEGNVGAGTGATVGKLFGLPRAMRGGLGTASLRLGDVVVGALLAVNAVGDVRDPETGRLVAGARDSADGRALVDSAAAMRAGREPGRFGGGGTHTTIGVVATNARLTKAEATRVAGLAMLGFARALSPPHTTNDGDTLLALSVGDAVIEPTRLGDAAAEVVARAIVRGVRTASPLPGLPAVRDLEGGSG